LRNNKKFYLMSILLAITLFASAGLVFASGTTFEALAANFNFNINGEKAELSEQPVVIDGKTYLPVRAMGEAMGKRIGWDQDTKTIIINELLADGTYKAEEPAFNEHGWKAMVEVTVMDGIISEAKFDEVNEQGVYKSQDEAYLEQYKQVAGQDMLEAINALETALVNAQNVDLVDAVSGATYASYSFNALVAQALAAGPVEADQN